MIVKIIQRAFGHVTLYDCSTIVFNQLLETQVTVCIDLDVLNKGYVSLQLDRSDTEIYVMNNEGKTIDKYKWDK